jgi:hypothetical protein
VNDIGHVDSRKQTRASHYKRGHWAIDGSPDRSIDIFRWLAVRRAIASASSRSICHQFCRSDDDRALHDHPWWNLSILLRGQYDEHTISDGGVSVRTTRMAGELKFRKAKSAHRIELTHGPCWTLFLTGPRIREWGFHCPQGWRHWRIFTAGDRGELVGRGCGEDDEQ